MVRPACRPAANQASADFSRVRMLRRRGRARPPVSSRRCGRNAVRAMNARVLVVDDDLTIGEVVGDYLRDAGLETRHAPDGQSALSLAEEWAPDLVVLDLMLPGIDGLEVCRRLRAARDSQHPLPVIMLTALGEEGDRVLGLETGADDYVTKPFSPRELTLRIQAVLRRTAAQQDSPPPPPFRAGRFEVDIAARRIRQDDCELALTVREFDLLAFFITHSGQAFTRK